MVWVRYDPGGWSSTVAIRGAALLLERGERKAVCADEVAAGPGVMLGRQNGRGALSSVG
ncbi:hypothetical protein MCP1_60136 [Candidatus Terasakiella magnetica]|nr:hypothetical protein MCP1_60136 [Candidatus Terasakiella magnetica]